MSKKKTYLSIKDVMYIGKVYNVVHGIYKSYGEMVTIIDSTKRKHCVCCNGIVLDGHKICSDCESKAKKVGVKK